MSRSKQFFETAKKYIPGGVNSPVRACASVGADPLFISSAKGGAITCVDGNTYIDFVQSWGPMLLGHAHPEVSAAVHAAVDRGTSFGAPCEDEIILAKAIIDALPGVEMVRMVNSGTEATMSALRLARGHTGRDKVIKFEGCYHGHGDPFLASAGSGVATFSIPGTPGVPPAVVADTLLAPYNNLEAVETLFLAHDKAIAAVIVEPAAGNMGLVPPAEGFLPGLRALCDKYGAVLIFDEVITGFRAAYGGAQTRYGVTPDLTTLGKIIGGGLPVGAYGGKAEIMRNISPSGSVYQAGTLSGNPLAMAAGIATLKILRNSDYQALEARVEDLCKSLETIFSANNIPVYITRLGSMFTIFFSQSPVIDFSSAQKADSARYARFFRHIRGKGIFLAPSAFETAMASFAHSKEDFKALVDAAASFTN